MHQRVVRHASSNGHRSALRDPGSHMAVIIRTRMHWIGYVATIIWWSTVARSLSTLNRGHSYKISPKPCRIPGTPGSGNSQQGTCMFVWECIKSEGIHVGVCVDTFMFGSCCAKKDTKTTITPIITTTTTTTTTTTIIPTINWEDSVTTDLALGLSDTTLDIITTVKINNKTNEEVTIRPRPIHAIYTSRPKRPSSYELQLSPARLPDDGKNQMVEEDDTNQRLRTNNSYHHEVSPDKTTVIITKTPSPVLSTSPTLLSKPLNFQNSTEKEEDNIIVKETNSDQIAAASLNLIRTEKPPISWFSTSTSSIGSYSITKKPTYRPDSSYLSPTKTRPNFISKPHDLSQKPNKLWTTIKPDSHNTSTTTETSTSQTIHWRVTTEPAFITKHKYPSHLSTLPVSHRPDYTAHPNWDDKTWIQTTDKRPLINDDDRKDNDGETTNELSDKHRPSQNVNHQQQKKKPIDYAKPFGSSSHYITSSDIGSSSKLKPTRKRKPQPPRVTTTTDYPETLIQPSHETSIALSTSTTKISQSTPKKTTTTSTSTTLSPTTTTTTTTEIPPSTTKKSLLGSVPTVSAVIGNDDGKKSTQCGVPPLFPRPETRIVGGKDAPFGRWPWQVSVRRTSFFGFSSTHRCGGAVLNENWIATAGHCVDDLLTSQIRIRVGDYDFSSVQERLPYIERGIAKKVVHPKYNFFTYEYDLALVRLESSLVFAPHISPICLPATDDLLIGENATVTGWGRLSEGGTLPSVLQEVSVPIVSNDVCKSMFLRAGRHEFIPDIFLCAGYENGGQDSCQGDSGGPLQVRGKDGRYFLAGIISWGIGCGAASLPGVCTRISKFVPWILKNVADKNSVL
ncbi:serine proteinase stubble-like isoform X2 [Aphidius gifuensis]|nr:serine proteinase stubble-like isoform X2 [Aphidius gifuensis]